jgi:SAM-dependent methyltransferase
MPLQAARHEIVSAVEETHWWFVAQREMVAAVLQGRCPAGSTVLDVGCGTGAVMAALAYRYCVAGIDVDTASLQLCRERHPTLDVRQGEAEALDFADESFDAVLALDVIGNAGVRDKAALVHEARRVLRPGGVLVLQAAAYDWLRGAHDAAVGFDRRFTRTQLIALLQEAGLTPELATYRVSLLFPPAAATRLVRRHGSHNQVGAVPPLLNRALTAVSIAENRIARRHPLPFGLSAFSVGRRV